MKNYKWYGTDVSNTESLFEYGLLIRNVKGTDDIQCVYKHSLDNNGNPLFAFGWFNYNSWLKSLKENLGKNAFPNPQELASEWGFDNPKQYLKERTESNLLWDLIDYYGVNEIFTDAYVDLYTEEEIRNKLGEEVFNDYNPFLA